MQTERVSPKLSWCAPQRLRRIDGCAQVQECKQDTENWGRKARAVLKQMVIETTICLSSTLSTTTYKLTCNQEAQTAQEAQLANAPEGGSHQGTEELADVLAELEYSTGFMFLCVSPFGAKIKCKLTTRLSYLGKDRVNLFR